MLGKWLRSNYFDNYLLQDVRFASANEKRNYDDDALETQESQKGLYFILLSIIVIILGGAVASWLVRLGDLTLPYH